MDGHAIQRTPLELYRKPPRVGELLSTTYLITALPNRCQPHLQDVHLVETIVPNGDVFWNVSWLLENPSGFSQFRGTRPFSFSNSESAAKASLRVQVDKLM